MEYIADTCNDKTPIQKLYDANYNKSAPISKYINIKTITQEQWDELKQMALKQNCNYV